RTRLVTGCRLAPLSPRSGARGSVGQTFLSAGRQEGLPHKSLPPRPRSTGGEGEKQSDQGSVGGPGGPLLPGPVAVRVRQFLVRVGAQALLALALLLPGGLAVEVVVQEDAAANERDQHEQDEQDRQQHPAALVLADRQRVVLAGGLRRGLL